MKKNEFIWRHLLIQTLNQQNVFQQQALASLFKVSSSTVNSAVKPLRELGGVKVEKRGFQVIDYEKILFHWANHRRLSTDIKFQLRVNLPILEIEGRLPDQTITTAYSACREQFIEPPTQYDKIYCYHASPKTVADRFLGETVPGPANLFILQADPYLADPISLPQLFVDLWGLSDWYAKEFTNLVQSKMHELLS